MKNKELFIKALNTLLWSWGSDAPAEVVWGANELLEWYETEYNVALNARLNEDPMKIENSYKKVVQSINNN
jgi:hypothetical protein